MKFHPHNGYVLCKQINEKEHTVEEAGIVFTQDELPVYEIIDTGDMLDDFRFKLGDKIISNSIPVKLKSGDSYVYLVKDEYIAGKVV